MLEKIAVVFHPIWNYKKAKSGFAQNSRVWDILPIPNFDTDIGESWLPEEGIQLELDLLHIDKFTI